jgi:hypothetical protein
MTASLKARARPPTRKEDSPKILKTNIVSPPETEFPTAKQISDFIYFLACVPLERRDGGQINKLSREWSPALECWTTLSLHPKQRAENKSGAQARPLTRAQQQIYVFIFLARSPRAPGDSGTHPKAIRWGFGDFLGPPGGTRRPPRPKPAKK